MIRLAWSLVGATLVVACSAEEEAEMAALQARMGSIGAADQSQGDDLQIHGEVGALSIDEIEASLNEPGAHEPFVPEAPMGITSDLASLIPVDNPLTPAKVALGKQLYFDPRLSKDNTVSCASCHHPDMGWGDGSPVSKGIAGQMGGRSAPTILNRILAPVQFWDGRAASLEEQALGPIANPVEMGFTAKEAAARLNRIEGYRIQFEAVFGGEATPGRIAQAIAAFERTVVGGASPYDFHIAAKYFHEMGWDEEDETPEEKAEREAILALEREHPLSASARRGMALFFDKAECSLCHVGENFSDELYYNIGIGFPSEAPDVGREGHTGNEKERGAFRTPTLRNIAETAPYMHDGSLRTLREVVEHYNKGGSPNPWQSDRIRPLKLTSEEIDDLVRFMEEGLQGTVVRVQPPRLP